ncbi:MAG: intradiol ring-cleavage dioxygenase [Thalassobaculales bacterium]
MADGSGDAFRSPADRTDTMHTSRRRMLAAILALPGALVAGPAAGPAATPACGGEPSPAQTEGPYFTPQAPLRSDLAADVPGGPQISLGGFVVDRGCRPLARTIVELWQADPAGAYDNRGFRLRGRQLADEAGLWRFDTVIPGHYPGRTRHFHVKLTAPDGRRLTTQLYFPGEPGNQRDRIFDARLLMTLAEEGGRQTARFDFVL